MSVPPDHLKVDRCYLTSDGRVVRVITLLSDSQVYYASRIDGATGRAIWRGAVTHLEALASSIERDVPCNRTPEGDERASPTAWLWRLLSATLQ